MKMWDFGSFHINMVGYQSQVIPAILVGIVFALLYRFLKKHVPDMISMIVVPFFSLIPAMILAHTVIGPFGRMLGDGLAGIIMAGFNSCLLYTSRHRCPGKDAPGERGLPHRRSGGAGAGEKAAGGGPHAHDEGPDGA